MQSSTDRRAAAAQTAAGRLPLGTPRQPGNVSFYPHIQIVPRRQLAGGDRDDLGEEPTFRSASLQFPPSSNDRRPDSAASEDWASTPGASFADMARGYNKKDTDGLERPTSGPMPLAGFLRLQSGRNRKGNKSWRPLQPSDLSGGDDYDPSSPIEAHSASELPFNVNPISLSLDTTGNNMNATYASPIDGGRFSSVDTQLDVVGNHIRLFGQLPDLIRLHEQTGDFDGQVVFIGHPNRDVSAHQWSSDSFQWVNIGLWSHSRHKVEGSLACERFSTALSPNSIEYFKFAAQEKEKRIKEFGRKKVEPETTEPRPSLTEADRMASLSTVSSSPSQVFPAFTSANRTHETPERQSVAFDFSRNVTRTQLEDPFVTPPKRPQPAIPASLNFRAVPGPEVVGSMDFGYEFPLKSAPASSPFASRRTNMDPQSAHMQHERELHESRSELPPKDETSAHLREVDFGEEASSVFTTPAARMNSSQMQGSFSPEDICKRQQLKTRLRELSSETNRPSQPADQRVAVSDVPMLNTNIRSLFPPGLTVANPYRGASTLNANAAPYTRIPTAAQVLEESVGSTNTVANAPPAAQLYFSDPDGSRQSHVHEIANGLGQQTTTRQNLSGPFFAESMPTAHNPTASLAFRDSDEDKLMNWFRDGQRPVRQQEYAKSLIATTPAGNKIRQSGAIGEGFGKDHGHFKYENTSFFTRILENFSDYAEESHTGVRSGYFTRAWKPAHPAMCDSSPDGNNSFFEKVRSTSPQMRRAPARLQSTLQSDVRLSRGALMGSTKSKYLANVNGGYGGY
jgi:hypothetical protein